MNLPVVTPEQLEQEGFSPISHFDDARIDLSPELRLERVRKAALAFREEMLNEDSPVTFYQSINLIRAPYPTKYGLLNASKVLSPFMHIMNRLFVIQFESSTGPKTMLFSPSDIEANGETPFFKELRSGYGPFTDAISSFLAPIYHTVEQALEKVGIKPEEVDYISYDHLHTQDLRKWLGSHGKPGLFPNAKLLVMHQEWKSTLSLLPPQKEWYCPNGVEGIDPNKVLLLGSSVKLGKGVALVHTPGHTEGNHSLVAHTEDGIFVTSENGVGVDSYSPTHSNIPGVRSYTQRTGMEIVLNGNTLEGGLDQYISMVMEKTIAGPSKRNPDFANVAPSSELTSYWAFPGLKPTFYVGELKYGQKRGAVA